MRLKSICWGVLLSLGATGVYAAEPSVAENSEVVASDYPNSIAAVVNNRIITADEVRIQLLPVLPEIARQAPDQAAFEARLRDLGRETLDAIVERILIVQEFEEKFASKGAKVPKTAIDNQIKSYIAEYFNGDRSNLIEFLKTQGKSMRSFRKDQEEEAIVSIMKHEMVHSTTEVSPEKIERFYKEHEEDFYRPGSVELRQIMLTGSPIERAHKVAEVMAALSGGQPFAEVAKQYSEDDMAFEGGLWGWVERSDVAPSLSEAAFDLEAGEYSDPIDLGNFTFIVSVDAIKPEGIASLTDVREQIEHKLRAEFQQQEVKAWVERLRERAYIKYYI